MVLSSGSHCRSSGRVRPARPRRGPPHEIRVLAIGEFGPNQRIVTVRGNLARSFCPTRAGLPPQRGHHETAILYGKLDAVAGIETELQEKCFRDEHPNRITELAYRGLHVLQHSMNDAKRQLRPGRTGDNPSRNL